MAPTATSTTAVLGEEVPLPSGKKLPNRLGKSALEEVLGEIHGRVPSKAHFSLYEKWAEGDWGLVVTGNVAIDGTQMGSPMDVVVPFKDDPEYNYKLGLFRDWATASKGNAVKPPVVLVQLNHPGRQSPAVGGGHMPWTGSVAPSAVPLFNGDTANAFEKAMSYMFFGPTPHALTVAEIENLQSRFVQGARVAHEAGFDGIQLHCAHGYLLSQFLSPNVNRRTDKYGTDRMTMLLETIEKIRAALPVSSGFVVSVKLNSADYVSDGLQEQDALDNVRRLAMQGGCDIIEVSGGNYESVTMFSGKVKESTARREAFFLGFAQKAKAEIEGIDLSKSLLGASVAPRIMVTGGFRSRMAMADSVGSAGIDIVGLGRPACADPAFPKSLLNPEIPDADAKAPTYTIRGTSLVEKLPSRLIGGGIATVFHATLLYDIAYNHALSLQEPLPLKLFRTQTWPVLKFVVSWILTVIGLYLFVTHIGLFL